MSQFDPFVTAQAIENQTINVELTGAEPALSAERPR